MNQRGFGLMVYVIAIAVLAAAFLGYGQYRHGQGVDKERTRNLNAILEHESKMSAERRKHNDELDKLAKKYAVNTETSNRKIRELLSTNKVLADWWGATLPADAGAFSWMQPSDNHTLRGGPLADSSFTNPGKTRETN